MDSFPRVRILESGHVSFASCMDDRLGPDGPRPYDQDAPPPPEPIIASGGLCAPIGWDWRGLPARPGPFDWARL